MQLSLITFDLGGTLIGPSPSVGDTYAEVLKQRGIPADAQRINMRFPDALRTWTHGKAPRLSPRDQHGIWQSIVRDAIAEEQLPEETFNTVFAALFEAYARGDRWMILPDVRSVLRNLQRRGFRLAVISNSDSRMRRVLSDLDLDIYFEAIFLSAEIGYEKPDQRLFAHVSRAMGVDPQHILHVGDSVRHDAEGAEAAGFRHFLVKAGEHTLATLPAVL